jgi:hypothetical protein
VTEFGLMEVVRVYVAAASEEELEESQVTVVVMPR